MTTPKKGVAYIFSRALYSTASPGDFQVNPTIAAGDFKVSKDNGALVNLTNLPTVAPAGGVLVQFSLTAIEMTADRYDVVGIDQAGNEWGPIHIFGDTTLYTLDDVPTAIQVADQILLRDWTAIVASVPAYCVLNALRFLRNVWTLVSGAPPVLHVRKEDGVTDAWSRNVTTDAAGLPITGVS